jgi:methylmalonyl-CoA mutase
MVSKDEKLFLEFPSVSTNEWKELIISELKGEDFDKKLVWKTLDTFNVQPFYRAENLSELSYLESTPGMFPFTRGGHSCNNWEIRQNIVVWNIAEANKKAKEAIQWGAQGINFSFTDAIDRNCAELLLKGIDIKQVALHFNAVKDTLVFADSLVRFLKDNKISSDELQGSINFDPLRFYTTRGKFCCQSADAAFNLAKKLIIQFEHYPQFRVIGVSGILFKNAGASITQEIAFTLAAGVEYLTQLTDLGLKIEDIAPKITFDFGITSSYFPEIAKFRAARLLWANIVNAYPEVDKKYARMKIHAETSFWNMTIYDPYVNVLRTTTESMSAILGGVDAVTVKPFDASFRASNDFSERIARNQQIILKEESHFDKVSDPAAGAYFIENLTNNIAEEAWKTFLILEESGGYLQSLQKGIIQKSLQDMQLKRLTNIATRKETLLGINQFPNTSEKADDSVCDCAKQIWDMTLEGAEIETVKPLRMALDFENLRLQTDTYAKAAHRPTVFMLTIGNPVMRKARSQFASNFFACAGYQIIDNTGFNSVDEGVREALKQKVDIVVLCSSDEEYTILAPETFDKIGNKAIFIVAGNPVNCIEELKNKGIEYFIHVRCNVLELLKTMNRKLEIA